MAGFCIKNYVKITVVWDDAVYIGTYTPAVFNLGSTDLLVGPLDRLQGVPEIGWREKFQLYFH